MKKAAVTPSNPTSFTSTTTTRSSRKAQQEKDWTTKEKLYLASFAIKYGNAWASVARNMQSIFEKERPEGWLNTKNCAAQFDKMMKELGVDKRPKRNEPTDASSCVVYKKMTENRVKELEESIKNLRTLFIERKNQLDELDKQQQQQQTTQQATTTETTSETKATDKKLQIDEPKQEQKAATPITTTTTTAAANTTTDIKSIDKKAQPDDTEQKPQATAKAGPDSEKPPTRAVTRRESSRKNLDNTLNTLYKEACEIKDIDLFGRPTQSEERELYDRVIRKHMDLSIIKKRLGSDNNDAYAVINDLLLMFQNATIFYRPNHHVHKLAIDLRDKLLPHWEKALLETKPRSRH